MGDDFKLPLLRQTAQFYLDTLKIFDPPRVIRMLSGDRSVAAACVYFSLSVSQQEIGFNRAEGENILYRWINMLSPVHDHPPD